MHPAPPTDTSPARGSRRLATLAVAAGVALLAVMVLPFPAAGLWPGGGYSDVSTLSAVVGRGLVRFWEAGTADLSPELAASVAFWTRFHVVKAVLAVPLLVTSVLLGLALWRECVRSVGRGRRAWFAAAGVLEAPLVLLAVLLVVANVQGALVPLSSALGLVDVRGPEPALATAVRGIKDSLGTSTVVPASPARTRLLEDFAAYHRVMVGLGAIVTVGLVLVAARLWRRSRRTRSAQSGQSGQSARWVRLGGATAALVVAASFALITAANLSTAAHPAPALLGFFQGSS
jgi:hypothetical protein